jgi:putative drug exporter of the RND superfamily
MTALTRFVLRHKLVVVIVWLAVAAAGILTIKATTAGMTNNASMPGDAYRVDSQIVRTYGNGGGTTPLVPVVTAPAGTRIGSGAAAVRAHRALQAAAAAVPGSRLVDLATTGDRAFVANDGRTTFGLLYTAPQTNFGGPDPSAALSRALAASVPAGWATGVTGSTLLANGAPSSNQGTGILVQAMIGGIGALVILALVFGSFLALLPVIIGAVSVLAAFLAVGALEQVVEISQIVEFVIALIGLGIAIDYSLLVVTRWREERAAGADRHEAVVRAMEHAGRAVVFSGITVAIGLLSLVVIPVPFLRSVGYGGVLVPLASVAAAVTLLPVVLATVGPRLDWPRHRPDRTLGGSRFWTAWGRLAYRRRWAAAVVSSILLAALALPALGLTLGEPGASSQATSGPAHDALARLADGGVPSGVLTPIEVLTRNAPDQVAQQLRGIDGVWAAVVPSSSDPGSVAGSVVVSVLPHVESTVPAGQDTVRAVQDAVSGNPDVVGVGGTGASLVDFVHAVYGQFPLMLTLIGIATFLLLARAFRSVLLAAKAVAFNLISLAAAYGILTWVWQQGHGSQAVFGVTATGAITMWVPLVVFAFLFGLSMDYEVFILSRIREEYDRTGSAELAVTRGLGHTGRLVTSAAAILTLTFVSMATGPTTDLKILATGLGAGIIVDAVIVRCLMVPALVALFGGLNWWMPRSLARVLRVPVPPATPDPTVRELQAVG